jgi:hypothetical protein
LAWTIRKDSVIFETERAPVTALAPGTPANVDSSTMAAGADLLAHAQRRRGWAKLTDLQKERAAQLLLNAECYYPERGLNIIAGDNEVMRQRLGLSKGQWQKLARALKDARLIEVQRRFEGVPGNYRETGPAGWLYAKTDDIRPSQIPTKRKSDVVARVRRVEAENAVLRDEMKRMNDALRSINSIVQEHFPQRVKPGVKRRVIRRSSMP